MNTYIKVNKVFFDSIHVFCRLRDKKSAIKFETMEERESVVAGLSRAHRQDSSPEIR